MNSYHVAFIGTGIMGARMAARLIDAGHRLTVHSRTARKAEPLLARGARWAATPAQAAAHAECVFTMLGGPADVEAVYFGALLDAARPGTLLVDASTSSPRLAERIHAAAKARALRSLDAPVSGGPPGAESGALTIMVGGEASDFAAAQPLLGTLGATVLHLGAPGNGQRAKLVNQVVAMQNVIGAIEGLFLARKAGLDTSLVLQVLQNGMADSKSLRNSATRALQGDFSPNFHPAHVVKDLQLALEEAEALGMDLPGLRNARERWQELLRRFPEARAVQEVARLYA